MNSTQKTCIIICGPTAVGKTNISIALAQHFNTAIISADSRQCYKEMNIGVAKPADQQLHLVKHYFINSHAVKEEVNARVFERYALKAADEIFSANDIALVVGGTGLYIKAFTDGMDEIPAAAPALRDEISSSYKQQGLAWLQNEIKAKDPEWYQSGEIQNPQRMMRALEVIETTGKSILQFHEAKKATRNFKVIKIGLELPREVLYQRINARVDEMMKDGLENEVRSLMAYKNLNALQTVGYKELFEYLDGQNDLTTAINQIKQNTRHYAKRQLTWFKKDKSINWHSVVDYSQLINYLKNLV